MRIITIIIPMCVSLSFACARKSKIATEPETKGIYVDSVSFIYSEKDHDPYLLSIDSYAFNDSMNAVLDTLNIDELSKLNPVYTRYGEPLVYRKSSDTIFFDLIYTPTRGRFHFLETKTINDSIFVWLAGYIDKGKKAKPAKHCPCRVRAMVQLIVKDSVDYKIVYEDEPTE